MNEIAMVMVMTTAQYCCYKPQGSYYSRDNRKHKLRFCD